LCIVQEHLCQLPHPRLSVQWLAGQRHHHLRLYLESEKKQREVDITAADASNANLGLIDPFELITRCHGTFASL